ncbi:hypothetical protein BYT27DRAFT_7217127 [Phlegmacium glaucopus]|nr:hypothetical protein BYT27DRAFT_7217127 [Phlegmacium glaucopus]
MKGCPDGRLELVWGHQCDGDGWGMKETWTSSASSSGHSDGDGGRIECLDKLFKLIYVLNDKPPRPCLDSDVVENTADELLELNWEVLEAVGTRGKARKAMVDFLPKMVILKRLELLRAAQSSPQAIRIGPSSRATAELMAQHPEPSHGQGRAEPWKDYC